MIDLGRTEYTEDIKLVPGMVLAVYMDGGPKGPCGQSAAVTCPHVRIGVYKNFEEFREAMPIGRNGVRQMLQYCIIGSGGSAAFHLVNNR